MTTYVDSSALLKRYVSEPDSDLANDLLASDPVLVTSWITLVEVRRNLALALRGKALAAARRLFASDLEEMALVSVDQTTCHLAVGIAEDLGVRSLDSLHLASAQRLLIAAMPFITFDRRQAHAARLLGFSVLGA